MSAARLLVLGVVLLTGEAHGYQVRRELLSWRADDWAHIKPGSIYHAIKKAARDGLLVEVGEQSGDGGPDRVSYRITEAGKAELAVLVRAGLRIAKDSVLLNAALAMLPASPRAEATAAIDVRIAELEKAELQLRDWIGNPHPDMPEHVVEQAGLWTGHVQAELTWARGLRDRLAAGAYVMQDDRS